jgi:hypothetical protein
MNNAFPAVSMMQDPMVEGVETAVSPEAAQREMLMSAWLHLHRLIGYYNSRKAHGDNSPTLIKHRADAIACFRSVESELGLEQSIPRRVR